MIPLVRRILALLLCVSVLSAGAVAFASERDETISSEYVSISGSTCVVDSLYGVAAIYSTTSSQYHCFEYVSRFYETVYGITVEYNNWSVPETDSSSCWFELTTTPKTGDIAFASAARRGGSDHWAIVKSCDEEAGTVTLIEQNYKWNGAAEVNRTITLPSSYYVFYTLVSADGAVEPVIDVSLYAVEDTGLPEDDMDAGSDGLEIPEVEEDEDFTIDGEYSDYVLPYAIQAVELGMEIRTSGYMEEIDAETFCDLIISLLEAGDYNFDSLYHIRPGQSSLDIAWEMGIIDENLPESLETITREEAASILQRLSDYLGLNVSGDLSEVLEFADYTQISGWAVDAIAEMLEMEVMDGSTLYGAYTFQPTAAVTYEQALTMVMRLYDYEPDLVISTVKTETASSLTETADTAEEMISEILPTE